MRQGEIDETIPVACQVGVIPLAERDRWLSVAREVYSSVEKVVALKDGYALRIHPNKLEVLGEHIMRDRRCCAFLRWEVIVEQAGGPVWLRLRGPQGTAEFVAAAIVETGLLPRHVTREAGFGDVEKMEVLPENVEALADQVSHSDERAEARRRGPS